MIEDDDHATHTTIVTQHYMRRERMGRVANILSFYISSSVGRREMKPGVE